MAFAPTVKPLAVSPWPLALPRRVSIVCPGLRRVGVAALFPEIAFVAIEKIDSPDPLRPLPGVQLRRDHPAGAAVLAGKRLALPRVHQQHVVLDGTGER